MADKRFYTCKGPFSIEELARIGGCKIEQGSPKLMISDVAPLDLAEKGCISVLHVAKYLKLLETTKASACILTPEDISQAPQDMAVLTTNFPHRSFALITKAFYPQEKAEPIIDETAKIHPSAKIGKDCAIGPYVVIGENVEIGSNVIIGAHVVIEKGCVIGEATRISPQVTISHAFIGKHVYIKSGARLGQSGFGFFRDKGDQGGHVTVPQLGLLILHDYVEVGANTTIDRGSGSDTVIKEGSRIDNLVQIGHNVQIGKSCIMAGQSGISGSSTLGDFVALGGQVGIADHLHIGERVQIAAKSGIMSDIDPGQIMGGSPAMPIKTFYRQVAVLRKLTRGNSKTKIKESN